MNAPNLVQAYMQERIILGGRPMTRAEAIRQMQAEGQSTRCIDYFMAHVKPA